MKKISYKNLTIENIENLLKTGYITEIIFDADSKTINIKETEYFEVEKAIKELTNSMKTMVDAICEFGKKVYETFYEFGKNMMNKKITRKKFIKLLQSVGMQRNTINEIIQNNKKPYTYARYYEILKNFKR